MTDGDWDSLAKMITAVGVVLGGGWTFWKYFDVRGDEKEKDRRLATERAKSAQVEARKPFSMKQLDLYFQAAEAASRLAMLPRKDRESSAAWSTFWQLYWGALALVEDQRVATAMFNFGELLKHGAEQSELQTYALQLAHACRDSIAKSWKVSLPAIRT